MQAWIGSPRRSPSFHFPFARVCISFMAMFGLFTPRYVNEARYLIKNAHKLLCYKRDLWSRETVAGFEAQMKKLSEAIARRDEKAVGEESGRLEQLAGEYSPPPKDASIRENCEAVFVAIVVVLAMRTYFLQPFTIPTGSMQPTLNGIIGHKTSGAPPNVLMRVGEALILGRSYVNAVCEEDGMVPPDRDKMVEFQRFRFFTYTSFQCGSRTYTVPMPKSTLMQYFDVMPGMEYHKGDPIVHGYVDTGDHVFADKFTYNFRAPRGGDVFVFNTAGIAGIEKGNQMQGINTSQFFIKRLAGVPGDSLRVEPPYLYINGKRATEPGFERVMAAKDGYRGYSQGPSGGYLGTPESTFGVPEHSYFAMGDNSFNSLDSRYWGTVPQQNIAGRGLFVWWPFASHWGLIR